MYKKITRQKYNKLKNKTIRRGTFSLLQWKEVKEKYDKKNNNIKATIIRFHSKYCGHCVELNKIWPILIKKKSSLFNFIDVNDKEFQQGRLKELNKQFHVKMIVNGYPTIYKIINNHAISYNNNRDTSSLLKWMVV